MIRIPESISPHIPFRWFVEFVIDNSPQFRTASAIAKAALILGIDLDAVGAEVDIPESGLKLLRAALSDDEQPLELPPLKEVDTEHVVSPRVWYPYIAALLGLSAS